MIQPYWSWLAEIRQLRGGIRILVALAVFNCGFKVIVTGFSTWITWVEFDDQARPAVLLFLAWLSFLVLPAYGLFLASLYRAAAGLDEDTGAVSLPLLASARRLTIWSAAVSGGAVLLAPALLLVAVDATGAVLVVLATGLFALLTLSLTVRAVLWAQRLRRQSELWQSLSRGWPGTANNPAGGHPGPVWPWWPGVAANQPGQPSQSWTAPQGAVQPAQGQSPGPAPHRPLSGGPSPWTGNPFMAGHPPPTTAGPGSTPSPSPPAPGIPAGPAASAPGDEPPGPSGRQMPRGRA